MLGVSRVLKKKLRESLYPYPYLFHFWARVYLYLCGATCLRLGFCQ